MGNEPVAKTDAELRRQLRRLRAEYVQALLDLEEYKFTAATEDGGQRHALLNEWIRQYFVALGMRPVMGLFTPHATTHDRVQVIGEFIESVREFDAKRPPKTFKNICMKALSI